MATAETMETIKTVSSSKKKSQSFRKHEQATAFWFIFPAIVLLLVFVFYPMLQAFLSASKTIP